MIGRLYLLIFPMAAALVLALGLASPSSAARNIEVGFADDPGADNLLFSADGATRSLWAERIAATSASLVRLNVYWRRIVGAGVPANPTNPSDPAYDWDELDRAVKAAEAEGLKVLFTVLSAPDYAEGENRPADVRPGTWKPSGSRLREFAVALAARYSGSFPDPAPTAATLPRVELYEGWNEPNLDQYITPQRKGRKNRSPKIYRDLLNGFYSGIKAVDRANVVLSAGTGPFGERGDAPRIPPLEFWRNVFCLKNNKKLRFKRKGCPRPADRAQLDLFAHNAIASAGDGPRAGALLKDNATAADMHKLVDVIRAAEKRRTVRPKGMRRDVWSTEMWFESSPPEQSTERASSLKDQARHIAEVFYVLWKQRVDAGIFLQVRDSPYDPSAPIHVGLQSGIYFNDGTPKPSVAAARFPFVADRKSAKRVVVWGKAPGNGQLVIEHRKSGRWKRVGSFRVGRDRVFKEKIRARGKGDIRGRLGAETTITWPVKRKR